MRALRHRLTGDMIGLSATWVLLALLAVALRLPDIGNPLIDLDEQFYLLVGDRMLHGALPYVDIWDRKPIGLFLIYAACRLVGGDPWIGYQVVATLAVILTGVLIATLAKAIGGARAGIGAGAIYIVWLGFLGGRGGQSPVFYDAFVAGAALLVWYAIARPARARRLGLAAMLLCGLAIQIKPTVVLEGCWFGIALLIGMHRSGESWPAVARHAALLVATALVPTVLAYAVYVGIGHGAAWWFANVESVFHRGVASSEPIGARIGGIALMLAVPAALAAYGLLRTDRTSRWFVGGWLIVALIGVAAIPPYYNHYALPLLVPVAVLAGVGIADSAILVAVAGIAAAALLALSGYPHRGERAAARAGLAQVAAAIDRYRGDGCAFAFSAPPAFYIATRSCLPTPYAFAPHLTLANEAHAIGIDPRAEVARILASHPPVIIDGPLPHAMNRATVRLVARALAADYSPVGGAMGYTVYARRDLRQRPADIP